MADDVLGQFDSLNVWSRCDQRAPHKPLLVLNALGRWCRGEQGAVPFEDAEGADGAAEAVRPAAPVLPPRIPLLATPERRRLAGQQERFDAGRRMGSRPN
jgi:hypothetical protein